MARTPTTSKAAEDRQRSQSVRVARLARPVTWRSFRGLAEPYLQALRSEHPCPPTWRTLIEAAMEPEAVVLLVCREGAPTGWCIAEPRERGTGLAVMWIAHFYCPGDIGAARALVAEVEALARARGCGWVAFETAIPGMARRVGLAGFKPMATVYGKEVKHG